MTKREPVPRKPGRPRKFKEGRHQASVRFTPARYDDLKKSADKNRRSISEEIEERVGQSFRDDVLTSIKSDLDKIARETSDIATELLQKATDRIKAQDALIAELQRDSALNEEAIERVIAPAIEQALARFFAKLGGLK